MGNAGKELNDIILNINNEFKCIKFSVYRTALKLTKLQEVLRISEINTSYVISSFGRNDFHQMDNISYEDLHKLLQKITRSSGFSNVNIRTNICNIFAVFIFEVFRNTQTRTVSASSIILFFVLLSENDITKKYQMLYKSYTDSGIVLTKSKLGMLLTDATKLIGVFGESFTKVSSAVQNCFLGVLGCGISEQHFVNWCLEEPACLVWLPTMHRLIYSKSSIHEIQCSACKVKPIVGLRFQCLKCLDYNTCQICFLTQEVGSKSHRVTHPQQEYCSPAVGKDKINSFARTIRNKVTKRYKRKSKYLMNSGDSNSSMLSEMNINQLQDFNSPDNHSHTSFNEASFTSADVSNLVSEEKNQLQVIVKKLQEENEKMSGTIHLLESSKNEEYNTDYEDISLLQSKLDTLTEHNRSLEGELENLKCVVFSNDFMLNTSAATNNSKVSVEHPDQSSNQGMYMTIQSNPDKIHDFRYTSNASTPGPSTSYNSLPRLVSNEKNEQLKKPWYFNDEVPVTPERNFRSTKTKSLVSSSTLSMHGSYYDDGNDKQLCNEPNPSVPCYSTASAAESTPSKKSTISNEEKLQSDVESFVKSLLSNDKTPKDDLQGFLRSVAAVGDSLNDFIDEAISLQQ